MYDLQAYGAMIADQCRMAAYARALEARITEGAVVADLGTGSGIMALIACRAGARRVYAVEPDDVIQVAREAAAANGFADRICFFQARSSEIDLPERVDGIVSDLRGALPFFEGGIAAVIDARHRWLKPGRGWLIAERDTLWASPVSSPPLRSRCVTSWKNALGFDFSSARARCANRLADAALEQDEVPLPAQCWAAIDYASIQDPNISGEVAWTLDRKIAVDGLGVWFDTRTAGGFGFSNSPASDPHVYRQMFLPWPDTVALDDGDEVRVSLRADLVDARYVISWTTDIADGRSNRLKRSFRQSTFNGATLSAETARRRAESYVPDPGGWAAVDRRALELMDGRLSIGEIADRMMLEFPLALSNRRDTLTRVGALSERYAKPAGPREL
jgi:protein arginine N-methyltransferase 1